MPEPLSETKLEARRAAPYTGQMRKSRARVRASAAFAGRPRMPEYLSDVAAAKWKELVKHLSQRGVLTRGDGPQLEILCTVWARWRKCVDEVERDGPIVECAVTSNSGEVHIVRKESPAAKMAGKLEIQLRQLLRELTLTVASREKAKPVAKNPSKEPYPVRSAGWYLEQMEREREENSNDGRIDEAVAGTDSAND